MKGTFKTKIRTQVPLSNYCFRWTMVELKATSPKMDLMNRFQSQFRGKIGVASGKT